MKANQTTVAQFRDLFSKVSRIVKQIVEEDKKEKADSLPQYFRNVSKQAPNPDNDDDIEEMLYIDPQQAEALIKKRKKQNARLEKKGDEEIEKELMEEDFYTWIPKYGMPDPNDPISKHPWYATLYIRLTVGDLLLLPLAHARNFRKERKERRQLWLDSHLQVMQLYDSCSQEGLEISSVVMAKKCKSLGRSWYQDTLDMIKIKRNRVKIKQSPKNILHKNLFKGRTIDQEAMYLQEQILHYMRTENVRMIDKILQDIGPSSDHWWYPKEIITADDILNHGLYCAMVFRLDLLQKVQAEGSVMKQHFKDAAYSYQMAFLDIMAYCEQHRVYDDHSLLKETQDLITNPWQRFYPHYDCALHWGDLPDLSNVLISDIMLFGDRKDPAFSDIGNLIQKCVPFACQRRHVFDQIEPACNDEAFYRVFKFIMWACFSGLYPGSRKRPCDGRTLLMIYRICNDKNRLLGILAPVETEKKNKRSVVIVLTAVRLFILAMVYQNPVYRFAVPEPDWKEVEYSVGQMADVIRNCDFFSSDPLRMARSKLEKIYKRSKKYRYRQKALSHKLRSMFSKLLADFVFLEKEKLRGELDLMLRTMDDIRKEQFNEKMYYQMLKTHLKKHIEDIVPGDVISLANRLIVLSKEHRRLLKVFSEDLSSEIKDNILNLVINIPHQYWYDIRTFYVLTDPKYGGISKSSAKLMLRLTLVNLKAAVPKTSAVISDLLTPRDVKVFAWYWNCVKKMDWYHLVPLPAHLVQKQERSMKQRVMTLYPGIQRLQEFNFETYITICCDTILSVDGSCIGREKVRFDEVLCDIFCMDYKKLSPYNMEKPTIDKKEQERRVKWMKKKFFHIPCYRQPVHRISTRGMMLIHKSNRSNQRRKMNCPQCCSFHEVSDVCWTLGEYRCIACIVDSALVSKIWSCAYCGVNVSPNWNKASEEEKEKWFPPDTFLNVFRPFKGTDPQDPSWDPTLWPEGIIQRLCFCKTHYASARLASERISKDLLWKHLSKRTVAKKIRDSERFG